MAGLSNLAREVIIAAPVGVVSSPAPWCIASSGEIGALAMATNSRVAGAGLEYPPGQRGGDEAPSTKGAEYTRSMPS